MDIQQSTKTVREVIRKILNSGEKINDKTELIGGNSPVDSMQLVEICLALEDIADEKGFEFDWTSETTMSKSKSIFKNIESLSKEFLNQSKN